MSAEAAADRRGRTSDDYTPCVVLWPNGWTQRGNVLRSRAQSRAQAEAALRAGARRAWYCEGADGASSVV